MDQLRPASERVPRTRRNAVHWLNDQGTVHCGTALTAEQFGSGRAVRSLAQVTCGGCMDLLKRKSWEAYLAPRNVAPEPEPQPKPEETDEMQTECVQCDRTAIRYWGLHAFCPRCLPMEKVARPDAHKCPGCHQEQPPQVAWRGALCGTCKEDANARV